MYNLKVENDLGLPHHQQNAKLSKLIQGSIKRKGQAAQTLFYEEERVSFWPAGLFLLDKASLYLKLEDNRQQRILKHYNDVLLSDFYFLEKSGLAYCAKMILLGETTEIRQLYGLIAADEATHLEWFSPYVSAEFRIKPQGKLLPVLGKIIEDCDANSLYYLVQTIIEGWGLMTYKTMAASCLCPQFKETLTTIMQDEAIHHQTGPTLFDPSKISTQTGAFIYDKMKAYAEVLRVGPQTLVQCIEKEVGELSLNALEILFSDIKTELTSHLKLQILKNLMLQPQMGSYVERLVENGFTKPYSAAECAKIYQKNRHLEQFV